MTYIKTFFFVFQVFRNVLIKWLRMHIGLYNKRCACLHTFPDWAKIITFLFILNVFSPQVWKKVFCYGNLNIDPCFHLQSLPEKFGLWAAQIKIILRLSVSAGLTDKSEDHHKYWDTSSGSHECHHIVVTVFGPTEQAARHTENLHGYIGLKDRLSSTTNFTAQIIRDSVSFITSRYQGDSSSIHAIVSTLPTLQYCVCYKIWHKHHHNVQL